MNNLFSFLSILIISSFLINGSLSSKIFRSHECVHSKSCHSHDFERVARADPNEKITLTFAVKLKNIEQVYKIVEDVSNPKSSNYGKYWSFEKLNELTFNAVAKSSLFNYLKGFVEEREIKSLSEKGSFFEVDTNIKTAEKILKTKYHKFKSEKTGEVVSRTLEFELPDEVSEAIDFVDPTIQFPLLPNSVRYFRSWTKSSPTTTAMIPSILFSYYNISSNTVTNSSATQAVFELAGQYFSPSDLSEFQNLSHIPQDPVDYVVGKNIPSKCVKDSNVCMEPSLDVQYLLAVAQSSPTTYWMAQKGATFSSLIASVASNPKPPRVFSISFGSLEAQTQPSEQTRFSQTAAILGAQGVTIVVASGDDGAANYYARSSPKYCGFYPNYPANVPYVLSVGATMGPEVNQVESACEADKGGVITSAGGFSTVFQRPSYQDSQVQQYLLNSTGACPSETLFASQGRAFPDVAMAGNRYEFVAGGKFQIVSGTSASAPVFAGIITLVNNARLSRGKSTVGFVNPALYQLSESYPSVFHDVTVGNNRCTALSQSTNRPTCCPYGFGCTSGWDPVTGLGSVNVGLLIEAMANL